MDVYLTDCMKQLAPAWGVCDFDWVAGQLRPCAAKKRLPEGSRSILVALFPYYLGEAVYEGANLARYAVVPDYHQVAGARLEAACAALSARYAGEQFVPFVDDSPIPEVSAAVRAGLGLRGRHNLLIHPVYGSYVFLGEIVTTLALPPTAAADITPCLSCGRCAAACPNAALPSNGFIRERCLSHITQKPGELTAEENRLLRESGCAWGCDLCQTACPQNETAALTTLPEFLSDNRPKAHPGESCAGRAYAWRGQTAIERNLKIINYS